ncbi:MAG: hypothetical protein AAF208_02860 [Cyanobacteria bacterium P01_A01_bin.45]
MKNLTKILRTENSHLSWILRLNLYGLRTQLQEALKKSDTDPAKYTTQALLKEIDSLLQSSSVLQPIENRPPWEERIEQEVFEQGVLEQGVLEQEILEQEVFEPVPIISEQNSPTQVQAEEVENSKFDISEAAINRTETSAFETNKLEIGEADTKIQLKLEHLPKILLSDKEILNHIGEYQMTSSNDVELWRELQSLLLRVPEKTALTWRKKLLKLASEVGAVENKLHLEQIPFIRTECLYPSLSGSVNVSGIMLSEQIEIDSRIPLISQLPHIQTLAKIISIYLKFIEKEPNLHHALKSVDRFGVKPLNSELEKSKYITALLERFRIVQVNLNQEHLNQEHLNQDPIASLRAHLDLDEAIHSLVYLPPADRYSWWGKLQQEARRTLDIPVEKARQNNHQVLIRPLWGIYADIHTYSKDDLRLDSGGIPGEVSASLRVYTKINNEVLPGRVIFRAS